MRRIIVFILSGFLLLSSASAANETEKEALDIASKSAILMECKTGSILYEKDCHIRQPPASVTKIMTMLLVMEAIDDGVLDYNQSVTASAHAASMGGSQIWLEEGETMSVDDMLKCVAVVSANDCAVALAEKIAGSESVFVQKMNERAAELGMVDTHFTNCTGLFDDDEHYSSAYDIALMSRELMTHDAIKNYTTIWTDTVRNGEFGLSNTNKLIYHYENATGLKTGFTAKAMYCLSATAEREDVEYVAVVLHAPSSAERFSDAAMLLNYAFSNYTLIALRPETALPPVKVTMGKQNAVSLYYDGEEFLLTERDCGKDLNYEIEIIEEAKAPIVQGQTLGAVTVKDRDKVIKVLPLCAEYSIEKLGFGDIFIQIVKGFSGYIDG